MCVLQSERLQKAWRREHTRFKHDYNDKLYNGLVLLLLVDILTFRFVIKFSILESLGWVVFLFLQVWPPESLPNCLISGRCGPQPKFCHCSDSGGQNCVLVACAVVLGFAMSL